MAIFSLAGVADGEKNLLLVRVDASDLPIATRPLEHLSTVDFMVLATKPRRPLALLSYQLIDPLL
jgi:hypothetical protein